MRSSEMYMALRVQHDALTAFAQPLIANHLALAFYLPGDNMPEHVRCAKDHRPEYLAQHIGQIPRTEDEFRDWEGKSALCDALILDTMMNVQDEMLGADDSRGDYMPDGIEQIAALTEDSYDGNGFLWYCINNLYKTKYPYPIDEATANKVTEHIYENFNCIALQDCTSALLYDLSVAFNA